MWFHRDTKLFVHGLVVSYRSARRSPPTTPRTTPCRRRDGAPGQFNETPRGCHATQLLRILPLVPEELQHAHAGSGTALAPHSVRPVVDGMGGVRVALVAFGGRNL